MEAPEHDCQFSLENWKDGRNFECLRCKQTLTKPSTADDDSVKAWLCDKHYVFLCLKCTPGGTTNEIDLNNNISGGVELRNADDDTHLN